jgi:hypothetical protein
MVGFSLRLTKKAARSNNLTAFFALYFSKILLLNNCLACHLPLFIDNIQVIMPACP